jgi:iron(III) transport system substrate-binding protein
MELSKLITCSAAAAAMAFWSSAAGAQAATMSAHEKGLYEAAKKEGSIIWYVSQTTTERADGACQIFMKKYPGVKCNAVRASGQVVFQRLMQETQANVRQADVISTNDDAHLVILKQADQLAQYKPENEAAMLPAVRNAGDPGFWSVTAISPLGISYNKKLVKPEDAPKTWQDLLDPKWKNQVAIAHPGFSGSAGVWTVALSKLYGWEYFEKLAKNNPQIGRSVADGLNLTASGERKISLAPLVLIEDEARKGTSIAAVYPKDGAVLPPGVSAILKGAPHPNAARLFMEFLLGVEYAEYTVQDTRWPVRADVKIPEGLPPLNEVKIVTVPTEEVMKTLEEAQQKFRSTFGI